MSVHGIQLRRLLRSARPEVDPVTTLTSIDQITTTLARSLKLEIVYLASILAPTPFTSCC